MTCASSSSSPSSFMRLDLLFLVPFTLIFAFSHAHGGVAGHVHQVHIQSLLPDNLCYQDDHASSKVPARLKVTHQHGPCSPAAGAKEIPSHKKILDNDRIHVDHLHHRGRTAVASELDLNGKLDQGTVSASKIPARSGLPLRTGNYVVTISYGTPAVAQTVIFDTGSDVTWIQCQPCVASCYAQKDPLFDPTKSSTYANISCSSSYCAELDASSCSSSTCVYVVQYGDTSSTVGFFAQDTLALSPYDVLPNFRFGCGENNGGLFGKTAGLLGLGRGKVSLVSQAYQRYGGVFSYCLPSTSSSTGYLTFGRDGAPSRDVQYTPMLSDANSPTFYYLKLVGITVGGSQLPLSESVFSVGGTVIDSGTVITRLPPTAYEALRAVFRQWMTQYKTAPALSILDTCYDFTGYTRLTVPSVALLFDGGATVKLNPSGILYVAKVSQACLAFAANAASSDLSILGNVQQRMLNVVYDISNQVIGFGSGGC